MQKYKNKSGNSGIDYYQIATNSIAIKFKHEAAVYTYRIPKITKLHLDKMKELAIEGKGLSTYIAQHPDVRDNYEKGK